MKPLTPSLALLLGIICSSCGVYHGGERGVQIYEVGGRLGHPAYDQLGVSAAFAGRVGGRLLLAGGANFPDKPASEGGKKAYYDLAFVGKPRQGGRHIDWVSAGHLPKALAYGVSLQTQDTLYIAGGESSEGSERGFYRLTLDPHGALHTDTLPPLPFTINNAAGATLGQYLYLIGGVQDGVASGSVWVYDLGHSEDGWRHLAELPEAGGYLQPVATVVGDSLYISGGFTLGDTERPARIHQGIHSLSLTNPQGGWHTYDDAARAPRHRDYWAGGCFVPIAGGILATGGVHTEIFEPALERIRRLKHGKETLSEEEITRLTQAQSAYMTQPIAWYQFTSDLYRYTPSQGRWRCIATARPDLLGRAGASAVAYTPEQIYLLQGELKPGIRSPKIIGVEITKPPRGR
nr:hypothetical protein [uncultured Porphyromonas sp.]